MAALHILNPNLDRLAKDQERERLKKHNTTDNTEAKSTNEWMGYEDWNFN